MNGVVLESAEFAYLLATLHATGVVGMEERELLPADDSAREAVFQEGFKKLQDHGWLMPVGQPGQLTLDDTLLLLAAVVAEPEFAIVSVRNTADDGRQLVYHYLAEPTIVEVSVTPEGRYRLGAVPDRAAMFKRIQQFLDLPESAKPLQAQMTIEEQAFEQIRSLAEDGQRKEAVAALRQQGLKKAGAEALEAALQSPAGDATVFVLRPRGGQVLAGRKATIARHADGAWLSSRVDAETTLLKVEAIQAEAFAGRLNEYLEYLSATSEPTG